MSNLETLKIDKNIEYSNFDAPAPFDAEAEIYDKRFTQSTLGRWLRREVWERLEANFKPGHHILELGCGTGEDALWLAKKGLRVTATDQSHNMLHLTKQKIERERLQHLVRIKFLDLNDPKEFFDSKFDGVFANFGVLNCVKNRNHLAMTLSQWILSGGRGVFVLMNPYCPWEMLVHILHGQFAKSFRRIGKEGISVPLSGGSKIQVWYPAPRELQSEFAPYFKLMRLQGLSVLLPPSYLKGWVERFQRVFEKLFWIEKKWARHYPWNRLNDHYILELKRC